MDVSTRRCVPLDQGRVSASGSGRVSASGSREVSASGLGRVSASGSGGCLPLDWGGCLTLGQGRVTASGSREVSASGSSGRPPSPHPSSPHTPLHHTLSVDRMTDTRLWKHYLPATTVAGGNNLRQGRMCALLSCFHYFIIDTMRLSSPSCFQGWIWTCPTVAAGVSWGGCTGEVGGAPAMATAPAPCTARPGTCTPGTSRTDRPWHQAEHRWRVPRLPKHGSRFSLISNWSISHHQGHVRLEAPELTNHGESFFVYLSKVQDFH